jgi:phospholipid/cholesterol/gamma-HCH transport system substrate-binding protein
MTRRKHCALTVVVAGAAVLLAGCGFGGLNSVTLPGAVGTGGSGYTFTAEFSSAANLVPNSEVKVDDITVGTVDAISLDGWHAKVTISLRKEIHLPANSVATIGQKSLLGAEYVQLAPPDTEPPVGQLRAGDVIPLSHTGRYPETEEVLAALSLWLNGGGLQQIQTIAGEVDNALAGNERAARDLLANLNTFIGTLNTQRDQLTRTITAVDTLSATLNTQRQQLGTAIDQIGPGLAVLNQQTAHLTDALAALNNLGVVGTQVINGSRASLLADVHQLQPTLARLVQAGDAIPKSLDLLATFLFPARMLPYVVKGDFLNAFATVDVSLPALARGLLPGTPVAQAVPLLLTALQATNPLTGPLTNAVNGTTGSVVVGGNSGGLISPASPAPTPPTSTPPASGGSCGLLGSLLGGC